MLTAVKAGLLYFAAVFGAGFVLGVVRVLWVAPLVGPRAAELIEMPLMLAVMAAAAVWIMRRLSVPPRAAARAGMGGLALLLVGAAEFAVMRLRGLTFDTYAQTLDPVTGTLYYAMLALFAVLPLLVVPLRPRRLAVLALAAAVIIPSGLAAQLYRRDITLARMSAALGGRIAQTPCGPIEYASVGEGPAVLLVHGAGGGYDQVSGYARTLAAQGFRAVTMSRFGYLGTPLPRDASPAAQADAHACLLDFLQLERAAIVGISAGAPSSMQFALRHRERCSALVLLVPLAYAPRAPAPPSAAFLAALVTLKSDFLFWSATKAAPSLVLRTILATPPEALAGAGEKDRARVAGLMRGILPVSRRQAGLANDAAIGTSIARYELERIGVPTLAISVADDLYGTYESARYSAGAIPGARFVGYPGGGHVWVGHDEEIVAQLQAFLAGRKGNPKEAS